MERESTELSSAREENPEQALLRDNVISYLKNCNPPYVKETPDGDIWNVYAAYEVFYENPNLGKYSISSDKRVTIGKQNFFDLFKYEEVLSITTPSDKPEKQRLFFFPKNREELQDADALAELYRQSSWGPWNLGMVKDWNARLSLASGEDITINELFDAYTLARETADPAGVEEELRWAIEDYFEKIGIIRAHATDGGQTIRTWDVDQLKECNIAILKNLYTKTIAGPDRAKRRPIRSFPDFVRLFRSTKVISENDFRALEETSDYHTHEKYIFALPESEQEAFDPKSIKAELNGSYIKPSSIGSNVASWDAWVACRNGDRVSLAELHIAQTLVSDLSAERIGSKLMVKDKDGSPVEFSVNRFRSELRINDFINNPIEYAQSKLPNLLDSGILQLSDIGVTTEKGGRFRRAEHRVQRTGDARINGLTYNLGSAYDTRKEVARPDPHWHITELTPDIAGVIQTMDDGSKQLVAGFRILTTEEARHQRMGRVSPKEIEWIANELLLGTKQLPGESDEQLLKRGRHVPDFDFVQHITDALAQKTSIGIHRLLSLREQLWLAAAANTEGSKERIITSSINYGVPFLRTFLSCELDMNQTEIILSLAESTAISDEQKTTIFKLYAQLADSAQNVAEYVRKNFKKNNPDEAVDAITHNVLLRGKNLLGTLNTARGNEGDIDRIIKELNNTKTDALLFAESFKVLRDSGEQVDIRDATSVRLMGIASRDLRQDANLIKQLHDLYDANWAARTNPKYLKKLHADLDDLIASDSDESKFYLLQDIESDAVLASLGFDDRGDGTLYAYALNVLPLLQGKKIGDAVFDTAIAQEGRSHTIVAVCDPSAKVSRHYIEKNNFVAKGYKIMEGGELRLEIIRSPFRESGTRITHEEAIALAEDYQLQKQGQFRVRKIPRNELTQENTIFLEQVFLPLNAGYLLTGYFDEGVSTYCIFKKKHGEEQSQLKGEPRSANSKYN